MSEPAVRSVGKGMRTFKRIAKGGVVTHGYMDAVAADAVFREYLAEVGLAQSSEADRDELLGLITECLVDGTSAERDYDIVSFELNGVRHSVGPLVTVASRHTVAENPLRVWARSYNAGEVALRIFDFLNTEENTAARQRAAARYGSDLSMSPFCFDINEVLLNTGRHYSAAERNFINEARKYKVTDATERAQEKGKAQAAPDAGGMVGNSIKAPLFAPVESRSKFPNLR